MFAILTLISHRSILALYAVDKGLRGRSVLQSSCYWFCYVRTAQDWFAFVNNRHVAMSLYDIMRLKITKLAVSAMPHWHEGEMNRYK